MRELRRQVEWYDNTGEIAQVYSSGLEYAFCTEDFKQQLPWVFCKDFLHDAIFSFLHQTKLDLYGYRYNPETQPAPSVRRMRLLVTNQRDADFGTKVTNSADFVNQVEKAMGLPSLSRVFVCPNPPEKYKKCGVYMFSGSGRWLVSPPMVSLYTLCARAGFAHTEGVPYAETINKIVAGEVPGYQTRDATQLKEALPGIERLVGEGFQNVFGDDMRANYPPNMQTFDMHHQFGIVSFSKGITKKFAPQWHPADQVVTA